MSTRPTCVRPPGARVCSWERFNAAPSPDNEWASVEEYDESVYGRVMQIAADKVPPRVMAKATGDFMDLIEVARRGEASFGRGNRYDVDRLDITDGVLELKWDSLPPNYKDSPYVGLRLYFAEPSVQPGLLLKLKLVCKIPSRAIQDSDALESQNRLNNWLTGRS